jgi:hypothetical protein
MCCALPTRLIAAAFAAPDGSGDNDRKKFFTFNAGRGEIRIGSKVFGLPRHPSLRIALGVGLILGGVLGFLPVLGFWMLPLGLLVLSLDLPLVRRWRRSFVVRRERRNGKREQRESAASRSPAEKEEKGNEWRPRPESNRGARICSPLRNHSATRPHAGYSPDGWQIDGESQRRKGHLGLRTGFSSASAVENPEFDGRRSGSA